MTKYPSKGESVWLNTVKSTTYPQLTGEVKVDVAVIGAGIAGLSAAYFLKKQGKTVAVLEKETVGGGVSGYTTGKVSSLHGSSNYSQLIDSFGEATAKSYGAAHEAAIEQIEKIIETEQIDCDWRREDNYVFTRKSGEVEKLRREADEASKLGLPAYFMTETPLPFEIEGAVRFDNQATFHVLKYLQGLARVVDGEGSYVFEHTKASQFHDGTPCTVKTPQCNVIATDIIHATNAPSAIKDHAAYGLLEYPTRSYIVAGKVDQKLRGMYISAESPTRSLLPTEINGEQWLLIGGEGHFVGMSGPAKGRYERLEAYAKKHFKMQDIAYRWSTWDFVAYDSIPLIGRLYPFSKHSYVATGLKKWGLSGGTVAGMILADTICGEQNPYASTFRSDRLSTVTSLPKGLLGGIGWRK